MPRLFDLARPLVFTLDAESAHKLTIRALAAAPVPRAPVPDPILSTTLAGLRFPTPVGLAAGFDKNAEVPDKMLRLGFGFVEVGTLTPLPQPGNPKPRVFRLPQDRGVINRLGFNNDGIEKGLKRLKRLRYHNMPGIVGVNVGANKDSEDRIADYETGVRGAAPVADYLTINISSPNTPGLRALQSKNALAELLTRSLAARDRRDVPVFLKVAPDLTDADVADIADVTRDSGIAALICGNTTISRPDTLASPSRTEQGGLSGAPLKDLALDRLKAFRQATGGALPLIAAGGIASADDAYARIRAGASLVQLYSALVYEGPGLARRIAEGLAAHLRADRLAGVAAAVGADAPATDQPRSG